MSTLLASAMVLTMVSFASVSASAAEIQSSDEAYKFEVKSDSSTVRKNVTSIECSSDTKPDFIYSGDTFYIDMSEIEFNVKFSDGKSAVFSYNFWSNLFTNDLGEYNTIAYTCEIDVNTAEAKFTMRGKNQSKGVSVVVPVNPLEVESLSIVSQPAKTEYIAYNNEYFSPDGLVVLMNFADGTSREIDVTQDFIGYSMSVSYNSEKKSIDYPQFRFEKGNNEVIISFGDCTAPLNVTAKGVDSIEIQKLPESTDFIADDTIDSYMLISEMEVLVNFEDGTSVKLKGDEDGYFESDATIFDCEIVGMDEELYGYKVAEGKNTITLAYGGKTDTFEITGHVLESIEITKLPEKVNAPIESFVSLAEYFSEMKIKANFTDGNSCVYPVGNTDTEFLVSAKFTGKNIYEDYWLLVQPGENHIKVSVNGCTADFVIIGREVEKFEVIKGAEDSEYIAGTTYESFSMFWDFEFKVTYDDGTSEITDMGKNPDLFFDIIPYGKCVEFDELYVDECLYTAYFTFKEGKNVVTLEYFGATADVEFTAVAQGEKNYYDVNGDGTKDVRDVTSLQMYLAGYDVEVMKDCVDVNRDGKVDVTDVTTLQMLLAGYKI